MKIQVALLMIIMCSCAVTDYNPGNTGGKKIYPDGLNPSCCAPLDSIEIQKNSWGKQGLTDFIFREGMLKLYERRDDAIQNFDRCWIINNTFCNCYLGAAFYYGDLKGEYRIAKELLTEGMRKSHCISAANRLVSVYDEMEKSFSEEAKCDIFTTQSDSFPRIGLWKDRKRTYDSIKKSMGCN